MDNMLDTLPGGSEEPDDKRRNVCPVCLRVDCALHVRIGKVVFGDELRREFYTRFHRAICGRCKRLLCHGRCKEKKLNVKKYRLPTWWKETK